MTPEIRDSEIPVDFDDTVVDAPMAKRRALPLPTNTPLDRFRTIKVGLRQGRYRDYDLDTLVRLQRDIDNAYAGIYKKYSVQQYKEIHDGDGNLTHLEFIEEPDSLLGSFLNDYLTMWAEICDLKEKAGHVPTPAYNNNSVTKR